MTPNQKINIEDLLKAAKASEHREAYQTLEKNPNFRIGVGVRLAAPNTPSFFIEILLSLCPDSTNVNLATLEKNVTCLKALHARNYTLTCQDDNCISCEKAAPAPNLTKEYTTIKALIDAIFS